MNKIILTRGLPASGKSSWAKEVAMKTPGLVRVNRDEIRSQLYPGQDYRDIDEDVITSVETSMVRAALHSGQDVIVDAMHLQQRYINRWQRLGHPVEIKEFHAPLETLLYRNDNRQDRVPASFLHSSYNKFTNKDGSLKKVTLHPEQYVTSSFEKYVLKSPSTRPAYIFDIDGTLAHNDGHRSFYDYTKVSEDKVHEHVAEVARSLYSGGADVVIVSGRESTSYGDTIEWLVKYDIPFDGVFMREAGDNRPDSVVKYEILNDRIAPWFDVVGVFDDRPSVCEMWRNIGIPTFQVGDPDNRF